MLQACTVAWKLVCARLECHSHRFVLEKLIETCISRRSRILSYKYRQRYLSLSLRAVNQTFASRGRWSTQKKVSSCPCPDKHNTPRNQRTRASPSCTLLVVCTVHSEPVRPCGTGSSRGRGAHAWTRVTTWSWPRDRPRKSSSSSSQPELGTPDAACLLLAATDLIKAPGVSCRSDHATWETAGTI